MLSLSFLLEPVSGVREIRGERNRMVGAIRYDSRQVQPGDLYVAINGPDDRGLSFAPQAIENGASVVVLDAPESINLTTSHEVTIVVVDDARLAMAQMAHHKAGYPAQNLKIYGVTGTNGKTTVAYVLKQLLDACGQATGLIGTLGKVLDRVIPTGYTTPEAPELVEILDEMVRAGYSSVVMEVSSHALILQRVACIKFAGAVFTNLTQDHLDFHITMDAYRDAKRQLFDKLDSERPAVVNIDDVHGESMVHDSLASIIRYGKSTSADARIESVELRPGTSQWKVTLSERLGGGSVTLTSPLVGAFNVYNVTAALALALAAGHDRNHLVGAVELLHGIPGRMDTIPLPDGAVAVVDYAHTPDALQNVLMALREIGPHARLTVVFGCGGDRDRAKRPLMGAIAATMADRIVLTSDNPRGEDPEAIISEIASGIPSGVEYRSVVDRRAAIVEALDLTGSSDVVLIAGKGHEDYQIVGGERRHFNDREVVIEWCNRSVAPRSNPPG